MASTPGDRERWSTCYIKRLTVGKIIALPEDRPVRPVVITATCTEIATDDRGYTKATTAVTAAYLDTGERTSVLTRCDLALWVTVGGHWRYVDDLRDPDTGDARCLGCGRSDHWGRMDDGGPCTSPATSDVIVDAVRGGAA
jgi:hypothetical protein